MPISLNAVGSWFSECCVAGAVAAVLTDPERATVSVGSVDAVAEVSGSAVVFFSSSSSRTSEGTRVMTGALWTGLGGVGRGGGGIEFATGSVVAAAAGPVEVAG